MGKFMICHAYNTKLEVFEKSAFSEDTIESISAVNDDDKRIRGINEQKGKEGKSLLYFKNNAGTALLVESIDELFPDAHENARKLECELKLKDHEMENRQSKLNQVGWKYYIINHLRNNPFGVIHFDTGISHDLNITFVVKDDGSVDIKNTTIDKISL